MLDEEPFHGAARPGAELQDGELGPVREHLDQHGAVFQTEGFRDLLADLPDFGLQGFRRVDRELAAEDGEVVGVADLVAVRDAQDVGSPAFYEKVHADFLPLEEFLDDDVRGASDGLGFAEGGAEFGGGADFFDPLGAVGVHRLDDQGIAQMGDGGLVQGRQDDVPGGGDAFLHENLLHEGLVGDEFGRGVVDVPRQPQVFGHLRHDEQHLVRADRDGEIDVFVLGDLLDSLDIEHVDLEELVGVWPCQRTGRPVHQDGFDAAGLQLFDQGDLRHAAGHDQGFHASFPPSMDWVVSCAGT